MRTQGRFDSNAWLVLMVTVGWGLLVVALSLYTFQFPTDGWRYGSSDSRQGAFTAELYLGVGNTDLRAGDIVFAIDGQPLLPDGIPPFPSALRAGQTLRYTVERSGQILAVDVLLRPLDGTALWRNLVGQFAIQPRELIVSLAALLVAAFAFFVRPGNLGGRYLLLVFGYFFVSSWFGFAISSFYASTFPFPIQVIYGLFGGLSWVWYFFASLIQLPLAFPIVKAPLRRFPRLLPALLYGVAFAVMLLSAYATVAAGETTIAPGALLFMFSYLFLTVFSIFGSLIHNWLTVTDPVGRAQLHWLALGMGLGLGVPFVTIFGVLAIGEEIGGASEWTFWLILLLPVCIAIAITRYRLFDIDLIIRKTLQYALITGLLALVYFGSVVLLQAIFGSVTGEQSPAVIVLSTLLIAALFTPLRRRVQEVIDRRFFRQKYDTQQVLAAFALTARDETDLDSLTDELTRVVQKAMQPDKTGVWIRPVEDRPQSTMPDGSPPPKGARR